MVWNCKKVKDFIHILVVPRHAYGALTAGIAVVLARRPLVDGEDGQDIGQVGRIVRPLPVDGDLRRLNVCTNNEVRGEHDRVVGFRR